MASYPQWPPAAGSPSSHPSAYPAPPPPPVAAALQNMVLPPELQALNITPQQVAALLAHIQAGTLPMPPPPPPPPQSFGSVAPFPPTPAASSGLQNGSHQSSRMDVDREEGEVSDFAQDARRTPPSSSRKRKLRANHTTSHPPQSSSASATEANVSDVSLRQKKEHVLPFIAALHGEGFTFDEFLREGFEESLLSHVFQELQIPRYPVTSAPQVPLVQTRQPASTFAHVSTNPPSQPANVALVQETTANKPAETAKAPAKVAAPLSRQDYLARLQAAKTKKSDAAALKASGQSSPAVPAIPSNAAAAATVVPAAPAVTQPSQPVSMVQTKVKSPVQTPGPIADAQTSTGTVANMQSKQSQTTELIRKRMEALKATQRRMANKTSTTSSAPSVVAVPQSDSQGPPKPTSTPLLASTTHTPVSTPQGGLPGLIPGLYMSTSTAKSPQPEAATQHSGSATPSMSIASAAPAMPSQSATPQPPVMPPVTRTIPSRKRPVASDLNEAQGPAASRPFKRPFGQSRRNSFDEAMIIQVSDDEDSSSDEDDKLSLAKTSGQDSVKPATVRDKNIRNLPPLRDFPHRSAFHKQQAVSTPPIGTPGMSSDAEELKRKEQEISSLNLRIKEYEKRKAALKAKALLEQKLSQTSSQTTPRSNTPTVLSSTDIGQVNPETTTAKPVVTQQPNPSPSNDRRSELKAALSARDADIVDQKARILEMQRQVAEMQKQHNEDMEKQGKLRDELEGLDIDTNGMTQSEMVAKKQEMDDLLQKKTAVNDLSADIISKNGLAQQSDLTPSVQDSGLTASTSKQQEDNDISMSEDDYEPSMSLPEQSVNSQLPTPGQASLPPSQVHSGTDDGSSMSESSESGDEQDEPPEVSADLSESPESGMVTTNASEMAESVGSAPAETQNDHVWLFLQNISSKSTIRDLRSLFSAFEVLDIQYPANDNNIGEDTKSGYIQLSMSQAVAAIDQLNGKTLHSRRIRLQMSPSEPKAASSPSESESDDEMDISESSSSDESGQDEDVTKRVTHDYAGGSTQPSAAASILKASDLEPSIAGEDSNEDDDGDDEEDDNRMDLESSESSSRSSSPEPAPISDSSASSQITNTRNPNVADDLAPELQPHVEQQAAISQATKSVAESTANHGFKPYESLLKKFKGYRFHPDFPREVQGGYRSLTYSHHIDPHKELCRFEVASGVCNDTSCEGQHFRDMTLSDDELLLQMGITSGNPGKTDEEANRYRDGLRAVLQQMRDEGNLQTEAVASRVAKYRRDFVQDPSNILGL